MRRIAPLSLLVALWCVVTDAQVPGITISLPNREDSVKFAAIGDNGTGGRPQYQVADRMVEARLGFKYDFVIMLGDNLYGRQLPADFVSKFERPYKALLDGGVKFYASLGNHDEQNNRFYKPWNMNGERYYTYTQKHARFFVLDTDYVDPKQLDWIDRRTEAIDRRVEDRLLPSSAVLIGGTPRIGDRPAARSRAAVRPVRRGRGLLRPRSRLRAHQAAEGDLLLRLGIGGPAAQGEPGAVRSDRRRLRSGQTRSCSSRSRRTRWRCRRSPGSARPWIRLRSRSRSASRRSRPQRAGTGRHENPESSGSSYLLTLDSNYLPENRTRTPPLYRRGVPVVVG